jgi:hypothetical protein
MQTYQRISNDRQAEGRQHAHRLAGLKFRPKGETLSWSGQLFSGVENVAFSMVAVQKDLNILFYLRATF